MTRCYKLTAPDGSLSWIRTAVPRRLIAASLFRRAIADMLDHARLLGYVKIERVNRKQWRAR